MSPKRRTLKQSPNEYSYQSAPLSQQPTYQHAIDNGIRAHQGAHNTNEVEVFVEDEGDVEVPVPEKPDVVYRDGRVLEEAHAPEVEVAPFQSTY